MIGLESALSMASNAHVPLRAITSAISVADRRELRDGSKVANVEGEGVAVWGRGFADRLEPGALS